MKCKLIKGTSENLKEVTESLGLRSKMKLTKDGTLENEDELKKAIGQEWSEFKTTVTEKGAVVEKPISTGKATKTKDEIMAIKDTAARQRAIAENHELFGF